MSLRGVDLFAGCGGSHEGWEQAGVEIVVAVENDPHAAETYRANYPGTVVIERDITKVSAADIFEAAGTDQIDIVSGSPPCQSWSMAGSRGMGGDKDGNGQLFLHYVRLVREIRPPASVAENVDGMTKGLARFALLRILRLLEEAGYSTHAKVLQAQCLGVPQTRSRLITLGLRDDLGLDAADWFPEPVPNVATIGDALPHIARIVRVSRPLTGDAHWREEESWSAAEPGPTLCASGLGNASWQYVGVETVEGELRPPTLEELLAYMGFRPDFRIDGELQKQWERLGNAVPPPMMRAVAERVVAALSSSGIALNGDAPDLVPPPNGDARDAVLR